MRLFIGFVVGVAVQPWLVLVVLAHPPPPPRSVVVRCGDTRRADDEALLTSARAAAEVDRLMRDAEERALIEKSIRNVEQCPDAMLTIATPVILGAIDKAEVQHVVTEHT